MAYKQDLRSAARRYHRAAEVLCRQSGPGDQPGCQAVAGYLFGLAGELAIKELMRASGVWPKSENERHSDPYFAHFPDLRLLIRTAPGRRAEELQRIGNDPRLFQFWDISMRYAPTTDITPAWVEAWRASAADLIRRMETV